jgi:hypothetical protein
MMTIIIALAGITLFAVTLFIASYEGSLQKIAALLLLPWRAYLLFMARVYCRCPMCQARALPRLTVRAPRDDTSKMWRQVEAFLTRPRKEGQ